MASVVIVGAGVGGTMAALVCVDAGHDVVLVEQDPLDLPASAEAAFAAWTRRGAPQMRHSHSFIPRLVVALRDRAPGLHQALLDAGARELPLADQVPVEMVDFAPEPGDEDLTALACRRTTFEWVLRTRLAATSASLVHGRVTGLVLGRQGEARGVSVEAQGSTAVVPGEVVIDASGARSALPGWVLAAGLQPVEERVSPAGIRYATRFYRRHPQAPVPPRGSLSDQEDHLAYGIYPGDAGTFSVSLMVPTHDRPMAALLGPAGFDAIVHAHPALRGWVDGAAAEALGPVRVMAGLQNRVRHTVIDGRPLVPGLVGLGDSTVRSNPLYGAGCTQAVLQALTLAEVLDQHRDARSRSLAYDQRVRAEVEQWHDLAVARDALRRPDPATARTRDLVRHGFTRAMRVDPDVWRAGLRVTNMLDSPGSLDDPVLMRRVLEVWAHAERGPTLRSLPSRDELLSLVADAVAV